MTLATHRFRIDDPFYKILVGILLFFACNSKTTNAQYNLAIGSNYVYAFGERTIALQGVNYELNPTHGFEFTVRNNYFVSAHPLKFNLNVGYRHLYFSGNSSATNYKGHLKKLFASSGFGYYFFDLLCVNGNIEVENNLAFKDFALGMGDLFRVSLTLEASYPLSDRICASALISRAMTPIAPTYTFSNPQYQLRIGINYRFI